LDLPHFDPLAPERNETCRHAGFLCRLGNRQLRFYSILAIAIARFSHSLSSPSYQDLTWVWASSLLREGDGAGHVRGDMRIFGSRLFKAEVLLPILIQI
jgi:hypothetical protein